ncbi:MliC family protein [Pseudomonas sp. N040]|uniref:MliC family protein n=1 Tax=Pseudomonas sp. N040 TaxID=2785325 RepID=UPI0018A2A2D5|nr:MliC family protein [Pseudomonas sp. N040]MBF7728953.1 MliC family protein [Pseudomonas sp. N040]MBW7012593.1 MliC family protein [Pseudomonas sp. N040]
MNAPLLICSSLLLAAGSAMAQGPSFDCSKVENGSIEELVCQNSELSALDQQMATVYAAALKKAGNEHPAYLKPTQRGWIKGRDDCWKADDIPACVRDNYVRRISELQARYRLVESIGPVTFSCNGNPADEVIVTFFKTVPATLIAERGDSTSLMYQAVSASGARYEGPNELFWEHQGTATIRWGYDAPEMACVKAR